MIHRARRHLAVWTLAAGLVLVGDRLAQPIAMSRDWAPPPAALVATRPELGEAAPTTSPAPSSQPATAPAAPAELDDLPAPAVGQFAVYTVSTAGPQARLKQTVESLGPGPNDATVNEQVLVNNQPVGQPTVLRIPRAGRRWPSPVHDDARTVSYGRERIEVPGPPSRGGLPLQPLDCTVLTIESRSGGSQRIEKQWISPAVPVTHLARLVVITDGREVMRQELVDFGSSNK